MKKIVSLFVVTLLVLQTVAVFATDIPVYKFTPVLDAVISEGEYPTASTFTLTKEFVESLGGDASGEMQDYMQATYRYAWDDENLYVAVEAVDKTPVLPKTWDIRNDVGLAGGVKSDGFQIVVFANKQYHRWFSVGVLEDGSIVARTHYFPSDPNLTNLTGQIVGKGAYTETGLVAEIAIPWIVILEGPQGIELSEEDLNTADDTFFLGQMVDGVEFVEGQEINVLMTYADMEGSNQTRYMNVDRLPVPNDRVKDYLVLAGERPVEEDTNDDDQGTTDTGSDDQGTTDDGADTGVDTGDDAAQTFDFGIIALVAAAVSAAAILFKKKR